MKNHTITIAVLLLAASSATTQSLAAEPVPAPVDSAATSALTKLRAAPHAEMLRVMGLRTSELPRLRVARSLPVRVLRLDDLLAYRAGDVPYAVTRDAQLTVNVLEVEDEGRSLMFIGNVGGTRRPVRVGGGPLARQVAETLRTTALRSSVEPPVLVTCPALSSEFLLSRASGWQLTPLQVDPRLGLAVGKPQDATTVLEALRSLAQEQEVPEHR
jgi:hypothetical protein